jgi:hypothetical protein
MALIRVHVTRAHRRRPHGWRLAGMRSNAAINDAKIQAINAMLAGKRVAFRVTRRWPV